jgi:hypothetical protein
MGLPPAESLMQMPAPTLEPGADNPPSDVNSADPMKALQESMKREARKKQKAADNKP